MRPRLVDRLRQRFATPITVLVAPAGFGKTTLLAQAVGENRLDPRGHDFWLTCRVDDVTGSCFAEGLGQALGLPPRSSIEAAVEGIVEAVWHRSPAEVALVVDDVHEIADAPAAVDVLARLVAALPANGHLVLAGRRAPPLALGRLDVQGAVQRLTEADLLFTEDELAEFAEQRAVEVTDLAGSGGWPALAELAASAGPAGPRVEAGYLWEEVLARIPPGPRRDLALLAHVGPVDDALAGAVLGRPVDVADLTADLPLVATTAGGGRQIHSLWVPHLAAEVGADDVAEARRRAGLHLAATGDPAPGVALLAEAEAWDDVTTVVSDVLGAAHAPVAGDVVATWLGQLPDQLAGGALARLLGAAAAVQTDPAAATRDLQEAADGFRVDGNIAGELACMAQLGQLAWWSENPLELLRLAQRLFEMEAQGIEAAQPLACVGRALIADMAADAEGTLAELGRIAAGAIRGTTLGLVHWMRATSLNFLGRLEAAQAEAEAAVVLCGPLLTPMVESARLQSRWFRGEVDEVLRAWPPIVDRMVATGLRNHTSLMASTACLAFGAAGRLDHATRYLELARSSAAAPQIPLIDVNLVIAEAIVLVARGDDAGAARVLAGYVDRSPPVGQGLAAFPQLRSLAIWYVLVPATRPAWDEAPLGSCYAVARDLARSLVAVREGGGLPRTAPPLPAPALVRAVLPLPWLTELALAHQAQSDPQRGRDLLDAVWPEAQPVVRRLAENSVSPLGRPARTALARLPVPPTGRLTLTLMGPVELRRDGVPVDVPAWRRHRVRSLLAHLVLHRPVTRERLGADLWPDMDADGQSHNLRVTLTHLLRVLEPERGERDASFLVRPQGGNGLLLHGGEWLEVDVWDFDALWARATDADRAGVPSRALDALRQAVDLWRDDPTELALQEWALPDIEERRLRLVQMAARAGELLLARDDPDEARRMGQAALRCDPWCERAHHVVVAAHLAGGQHRAARDALGRYREALAELGLSPDESARKLAPLELTAVTARGR